MTHPAHHLVDGVLEYKGFGGFLAEHGMEAKGEDYSVVAVFGGQSSGKSTLLNRLFKTNFQEMDAAADRGQTTQGVWMSNVATSDRLIVLDFEGTDSAERGEDESFEKKLSQFALALADVLIINFWQNEIGRQKAMSVPLLEKVIQINFDIQLQLSESNSRESKKMLMFVVRDYDSATPISRLEAKLYSTMEGIWSKISKPEKYQDDELDKWFDFKVTALPHYKQDTFDGECEKLAEKFINPEAEEYVFKTGDSWRRCGVQITELDGYANSCWKAIKENRDINIPGEKELVARHRSAEAARCEKDTMTNKVAEIKKQLEGGEKVPGLHATLSAAVADSVASFRKNTSQFKRYQEILDEEEAALRADLEEITHTALEVVHERVCKEVERGAKAALAEATNKVKESQDFETANLWKTLRVAVDNVHESVVMPELGKYEKENVIDGQGVRLCGVKMREALVNTLRDTMASKAAAMHELMGSRFLYALLHNNDGLPLNVKEEDLEKRCPDAYVEAMKVMDALLVWRFEEGMEGVTVRYPEFSKRDEGTAVVEGVVPSEDMYLFPKEKVRDTFVRFCGEVKGKIMEARLGLKNQLQLPAWVYLTFLLLGFDEAMWVISNPVIIITIAAVLYLFARQKVREVWIENMESGPTPVRVALTSAWPYVRDFLVEEADEAKPAVAKKND
eukprot:TRINITY_DN5769_c0_g1_i1.p1 TRINITY_DN5769_c0_g1~~TRINITY_DN5769_c0_g1_i1.p1  ORF type:complete len:679 (+),score=273.48 TRINITY_DN5769_c0_g1_i1:109-2145(+)